jgi:hypothetical protein
LDRQHPHLGATYKTVGLPNGTYNVEVTIPGSAVVTISKFKTEAAAAAWIADHERQIAQGTMARAKFNRWKPSTGTPKA